MTLPTQFQLRVQHVAQTCLFELVWGQGQRMTATLNYPIVLNELYIEWQQSYLDFYRSQTLPASLPDGSDLKDSLLDDALRGRVVFSDHVAHSVDWQSRLVEAEFKLLNEFHRWLRNAELFEIRAAIARSSHNGAEQQGVSVFLTCSPIELARLPWEAWEIGSDFAGTGMIRIIRTAATIQVESGSQCSRTRRRARILAILGDETGLDFHTDRAAVDSLSRIAEVKFVGWQPGQTTDAVKAQISRAIADPDGWDVLFFAGHSNETQITGGELAIAPNATLQISELAPQLSIAKQRGLQFAIFNSCSGLQIAESLIGLGFGQVAVMREPIHNRVAQDFLVQLVRHLAEHKDVHEALLAASQFLRMEKNLTYPSAYLVPSLFCHPGAELFRIPPFGWMQRIRQFAPLRWEAIGLATCLVLGLIPSIQDPLLDRRIGLQAVYRDWTEQVPAQMPPPVLLVQVDEMSVREARDRAVVDNPAPIHRGYLADLIDRLSVLNANVIGIDYILDRPVSHSEILRRSLQRSVQQQQTWFVFGIEYDHEAKSEFVAELGGIAEATWSSQGYVDYWETLYPSYIELPSSDVGCWQTCPFAYLLALIQAANQESAIGVFPQLEQTGTLRTDLLNEIEQAAPKSEKLEFLQRSHLNPLTSFVGNALNLIWWQPLIDYSIPPDRVYDRLAAWRLLDDDELKLPLLSQQTVIIGAGEYEDPAGAINQQLDLYPIPAAVTYWRDQLPLDNAAGTFPRGSTENSPDYLPQFTGAEAHAYMVHHLLNQHLVFAIPHIWMVGLTGIVSKGIVLVLNYRQRQYGWTRRRRIRYSLGFAATTILYGFAGLQLYVSAGVLLPWLLPSAMFWFYILPVLRRKL